MRQMGLISFMIFLLVLQRYPVAAQVNDAQISLNPPPSFNQIIHGETYNISVIFNYSEMKVEPGDPIEGQPYNEYTGNLFILLALDWVGRGSYDFGQSTTGYTINLEHMNPHIELNRTITFPNKGTQSIIWFNYAFTRDAHYFGVKPFEEVEIKITSTIYYEAENQNTGIVEKGPLITSTSQIFFLLDEDKKNYLNGKYQDMKEEINNLDELDDLQTFNKVRYYDILKDMNDSREKDDYFEAHEIYQRYDEKHRSKLIESLTAEINNSLKIIEELKGLKDDLYFLEVELELCKIEYENIESKYNALSNTYQKKQAELESAKRNLTTAITVVFISSIGFFFIGQKSVRGNIFEQQKKSEVEE
jgi:hypothetical protein